MRTVFSCGIELKEHFDQALWEVLGSLHGIRREKAMSGRVFVAPWA